MDESYEWVNLLSLTKHAALQSHQVATDIAQDASTLLICFVKSYHVTLPYIMQIVFQLSGIFVQRRNTNQHHIEILIITFFASSKTKCDVKGRILY